MVTGLPLLRSLARHPARWVAALVPLFLLPTPGGLYMPRAVRQAYEARTRAPDGRPGSRYWQNRGRYRITVTVAPPGRTVRGTEQITYFNQSPDSLASLFFKLFPNFHKPGAPRTGGAPEDFLTSGLHVDAFRVNGQPREWGNEARIMTTHGVRLPSPLPPGDSVSLSFDWHYDLSLRAGREGVIDSTTFFVAYFYPRVAVYDDYNGWDLMDHSGHEFYSDFNDYDVTFRAPANYVVWGTGTLTNAEALLQPAIAGRFRRSLTSDTTIRIATHDDMLAHRVTAQDSMLAWHFVASDIPDMAFGLSDHYDWDGGSVVVDDAAHRRASVQSAYNDTAADYHEMVRYGQHALDWLSREWPGVPYPYEKMTVFQGGAGMEYPMMANDQAYADTIFARFVAEHEIAHTWMPFYMGVNETRYAFMDEGWATTFEHLISIADVGPARADDFFRRFRVSGWIRDPSPLEDLPIITPADALTGIAYGNSAYGKAALGYLALKDMLGDDRFRKGLHAYMERWHGKHPTPWDFFYTFNDVTGKDLNWFWRRWYFENSYIDLAVTGATRAGNGWNVTLRNIGGMPAPVNLVVQRAGATDTMHVSPSAWASDQDQATVHVAGGSAIQSITLDGGIWMDADSTNDRWTAR